MRRFPSKQIARKTCHSFLMFTPMISVQKVNLSNEMVVKNSRQFILFWAVCFKLHRLCSIPSISFFGVSFLASNFSPIFHDTFFLSLSFLFFSCRLHQFFELRLTNGNMEQMRWHCLLLPAVATQSTRKLCSFPRQTVWVYVCRFVFA